MQGTISFLIGIHSPVHSILVLLSWRKLYGSWPKFWELICIFLHDIGHLGLKDYLLDSKVKAKHWVLGARIAGRLFGSKGYDLVAGHCEYSGVPRSPLYKADKYSWYICPAWLHLAFTFVEPDVFRGFTRMESVRDFQNRVKTSIESGEYTSSHGLYLARLKERGIKDGVNGNA